MPAENLLEEPSLALFQRQWKLYRKVVDNNYLFHREAYAQLHRILVDEGVRPFRFLFLIYENASPDGEDRTAWLRRHDSQKPFWTALTPEEWDAITAHIHTADFPETTSRWRSLGREAGFSRVRQLFVAPSNLFRLYCFQA